MKHVRIDNFIKYEIENGTFTLHYIPTKLSKSDFDSTLAKLGITKIHSPAWGGWECQESILSLGE